MTVSKTKYDKKEKELQDVLSDMEKIRHLTYALFGDSDGTVKEIITSEDRRINELEMRIKGIDKIIYPRYYNSSNESK